MICKYEFEKYVKEFADKTSDLTILDVGCGTGEYTAYFCGRNNKVTAIDIGDHRMPERYGSGYEFVRYNGERFPFPDENFDLVVNFDVIEHVEDDKLFVREIFRVLKKGGACLCATPNRTRLSNFLRGILGRKVSYPLVIAESSDFGKLVHVREYTSCELEKTFADAGFGATFIQPFWFGLMGIAGTAKPLIKKLSQYLIAHATK